MSRASKADVAQIAERLSERDWQIIRCIYQHRYATTTQLRRLFFTHHTTQGAATRACIRVLDRLLTLRILTRLERRVGGNLRGSAAYIWCLDVIGDRLTTPADAPRRRFHEPSHLFLAHTLAITETRVQLIESERAGGFRIDRMEIETQAWRSYLTPQGATTILKPDLMVTLSSVDYDDHWYIEIDQGTESLPVLLRKCHAYEDYRVTRRAHTEHGVFPRVLWVLPTHTRIERLHAALGADKILNPRLFVLTTPDQLIATLREPP
ncbi:MAG: replication-relaxation family protein [Ancrocorticia sp.]